MRFLFHNFCFFLNLLVLTFVWAERSPCNPVKGLKLLNRQNIYRPALNGLAQDVYVSYPSDRDPAKPDVEIGDFCVSDHDRNLFGAVPVLAYGVGEDQDGKFKQATIILRGLLSRGINSTVEFYGLFN